MELARIRCWRVCGKQRRFATFGPEPSLVGSLHRKHSASIIEFDHPVDLGGTCVDDKNNDGWYCTEPKSDQTTEEDYTNAESLGRLDDPSSK